MATVKRPMCRFRAIPFLATFLLAGLPAVSAAAEPDDKLSALAIFDNALAQFDNSRVALRKWQYHQTLTTDQMDGAGKVVAKGTWNSIVRPGDPGPLNTRPRAWKGSCRFSKQVPRSLRPQKHPERRSQKPKSSRKEIRPNLPSKRCGNTIYETDIFGNGFPDENFAGESAYVLAFEPKPKQNTKSREERFFGLLAGQLWISRSDFTVLKAKAALQSPCRLFWIIARVTTFQLTYELEPARAGNRLLRLTKATAKTVVTFPFYSVRQSHWQTVDKYEPRTARGGGAHALP